MVKVAVVKVSYIKQWQIFHSGDLFSQRRRIYEYRNPINELGKRVAINIHLLEKIAYPNLEEMSRKKKRTAKKARSLLRCHLPN